MNFINKYRRNNLQSRRGMILLVVMAVLSFFAVLGMTFILMTGKNRDSAEIAQLAAQNSKTAGNSPQELLEEGIMQVLVGPPDGNTTSALVDCDLIGDMYGGAADNNLEEVTASFSENKMTPENAEYAGRVVTIADGPYKGQSTLILNSRGTIVPFASGIGNTEQIDCTCVINKKRAFQGDAASYDAADVREDRNDSNDFMSLRYSGGIENSEIKIGRVVVPSYYRGESKRPGCSNPNELGADINAVNKYGVNPLADPIKTAASSAESPWDIDNDGDGDNDSVWMNLGLPPRPMPDGTLVVPMYAILVEDMDGRLNVNTHSPDETTATANYTQLGTTSIVLPTKKEKLDPTKMLNGQGFGPADVNLEALLDAKVSNVVSCRTGAQLDYFKYRFPDGNTEGGISSSVFSVTENYKTFRTPLDFYGVMAGVIDQNGMFVWEKRGTVGKLGQSSYERDLGYAQPKGERITNAPCKSFSPEELEGVLRVYDDDSQKLESRLLEIVKGTPDKNVVRNLITTESWDMPYCDISTINKSNLPEEIQAGFKMDINRPLTSYEDNVDLADAERTQLAKDLYLIARACVGQSKAAAQWAVNAVDFRDADSVCTHLQIDGFDVWGCERPELLITETFAYHARMTEDSEVGGFRSDDSQKCVEGALAAGETYINAEWYDSADVLTDDPQEADVQAFCQTYKLPYSKQQLSAYITLMKRVRNMKGDGIADLDQIYRPESGLFIELYNPWLTAGTQEAMPSNEYNADGVVLGNGGTSIKDYAWRLAVAGGKADGKSGDPYAKDLHEEGVTIDRVLYFGNSIPESGEGEFTYKAGVNVCVDPGQFAIIGPAGSSVLSRLDDYPDASSPGKVMREIKIQSGSSSSLDFDGKTYSNVSAIGVPDCDKKARFSITDIGSYTDPVDGNGKLTTPRDRPYDADDARWTQLKGINKGLGDDFDESGYRVVYLQRLANPYKEYNSTSNPYITFDQMPVDLYSYNGRQTSFADYKNTLTKGQKASDSDNMTLKEQLKNILKTRQRGEVQYSVGVQNLWRSEKFDAEITGERAKENGFGRTGGSTTEDLHAAMNQSFINSISAFETKLFKCKSTAIPSVSKQILPSYESTPSYYFPNRPFNSVMELMLVPQVSAYELTSSDNVIDKPSSAELESGNLPKYLHPDTGYIDFLSESGSKIFNYVRIQTPFVVTPMNLNTYNVNENNESVHASAAPSGYRWTFREPGKININSITHPAVWAALLGAKSETEAKSIDGFACPATDDTDMYNEYWGKVFTDSNPGTRPQVFGDSAANYIAANYLIFRMNSTAKECQSAANNVYFQTQLMQRLSNLTTTRSNVFAVWVTVGFFEYQNGSIGKEYGLDNGSRQRYRAFYIIDRTRPVGYSPGKRMNADKTIILRRYLP